MKKLEKNTLKEVTGGTQHKNIVKINGAIIDATAISVLKITPVAIGCSVSFNANANKPYQDASQTCEIEGQTASYTAETVGVNKN